MNTFQRIQHLANRNSVSIAELERKLNLSNGSIARWKKSAPSSRGLTLIADYFDVSVDYLLGRDKEEYSGEIKNKDILIMHRAAENMTEAQRQKALTILETMFDDWDDLTK